MNSRERFAHTMAHRSPDRVPIDIGGTSLTGMRPGCQRGVCRALGFAEPAHDIGNRVDERILDWAGTDFRSVGSIVDLPSKHTVPRSQEVYIDCWGVERGLVDGEWQITRNPLRGAESADLESYAWPEPRVDDTLLVSWQERARDLRAQDQFVVVAEHPVFGILELGCWMCGYDEFFMKMAADTDFVRFFFDKVAHIQMAVIEQYYSVLGPYIDLTTSGDDFGGQTGPLISPGMFESLIAPYFARRIERTKELTGSYYWHHTCGSVVRLLDQIIECGVDILNPIQTSAADMDPGSLKEKVGDRLVLWGGVDIQQFLPKAKPSEVGGYIRELIATLGQNGGYVIAPAHEIQDDVPPENIVAWIGAM